MPMLFLKKSALTNIVDSFCKTTYAEKPIKGDIVRKALTDVLPETPQYLDGEYFENFASKIASRAGEISYKIEPKKLEEGLMAIWNEKSSMQLDENYCVINTPVIVEQIEKMYKKYKHFPLNATLLEACQSFKRMVHTQFVNLISCTTGSERQCLQNQWKKLKAANLRTGMQLKKDEIATMIELHVKDLNIKETLIKLLQETVFLDSLNIMEFEYFLYATPYTFETEDILMAEWYEMAEKHKAQQQQEIPVPPGLEDKNVDDPNIEIKMHFEPLHAGVQPATQAPLPELSFEKMLLVLEKTVKTPTDLQRVYDKLASIKQNQELASLNHDYAEMKFDAEEQPAPVYYASNSSPAHNNSELPAAPLSHLPEQVLPLPSAPPLWALAPPSP